MKVYKRKTDYVYVYRLADLPHWLQRGLASKDATLCVGGTQVIPTDVLIESDGLLIHLSAAEFEHYYEEVSK